MGYSGGMSYKEIRDWKDADFKRITGVRRGTFERMLATLRQTLREFGRPPKLSRADQLLLTLMYWREYRTQFHIAQAYGVSESSACRTIAKVENALMSSGRFRIPGKKALQQSDTQIKVVLVDATEQPIERPKKNSAVITAVRRSGTHKKRK